MTIDEAQLLLREIFLTSAERLSEKVEYKHDRSETDAGNSALDTPSISDETRGVTCEPATLFETKS